MINYQRRILSHIAGYSTAEISSMNLTNLAQIEEPASRSRSG